MHVVSEITSKSEWSNFLEAETPHTFLHSWNWGEFQQLSGHKVYRLGAFKDSNLEAICLVMVIRAKRGIFLFCPHGPIIKGEEKKEEILKTIIGVLKALAKKEKASFIRISPLLENSEEHRRIFQKLEFRQAPIHMHPELAWILDITKSEEELLKGMRKQTRHCIRNAARFGVTVRQSHDIQDIDVFYTMYEDTVARQDFIPFSHEYLKKEFAEFAKDGKASIFLGIYKGEVISGAIVIFTNGSGFYHHGASNIRFSKIPAAHLLQWEIIREAKKRGLRWYNFWGIAPDAMPNHPWAGLSLFKKGFGGSSEAYVPAQDLMVNPLYWITYIIEKIRKIKRRL